MFGRFFIKLPQAIKHYGNTLSGESIFFPDKAIIVHVLRDTDTNRKGPSWSVLLYKVVFRSLSTHY